MASPYRHGCGVNMTVFVPRGFRYIEMTVRCGSTAHDGGVNQCDKCSEEDPMPAPYEGESDMDYFERTEDL